MAINDVVGGSIEGLGFLEFKDGIRIRGTYQGRDLKISRYTTFQGRSGCTSVTLTYKRAEQISRLSKEGWIEAAQLLGKSAGPIVLTEHRGTFELLTHGAEWSAYGPVRKAEIFPPVLSHLDELASALERIAARTQ